MFAFKVKNQYFDHCQHYICKWIMRTYRYKKWFMIVLLLPSLQRNLSGNFTEISENVRIVSLKKNSICLCHNQNQTFQILLIII